jgi:hypothetical protein
MAIGSAVSKGSLIYVCDVRGHQLCVLSGGNGPKDGLQSYTPSRVNIRRGSMIYVYDDNGTQRSVLTAR